jgi:hypothetical protein
LHPNIKSQIWVYASVFLTMFNPALDDQQAVVRLVDMYPQLFRANPLIRLWIFFFRDKLTARADVILA